MKGLAGKSSGRKAAERPAGSKPAVSQNVGNEANPNMEYTPAPATDGDLEQRMSKLQDILDRFEITVAQAQDLTVLQDYKLVVIADDSASMKKAAEPVKQRSLKRKIKTRWHELQETIAEIVDIASSLDPRGIDVFFLNRPPLYEVKHAEQDNFKSAFDEPPKGGTPLSETLSKVAARLSSTHMERKSLIFILTDGEPTGGPDEFMDVVTEVTSTGKVKLQIMACTSEEDEIQWLNGLDRSHKAVDVVDDYYAEKKEVISSGIMPKFTRGDWCMKAMLGPVCHKFDKWDEGVEKHVKIEGAVSKNYCNCIQQDKCIVM